MKKVLASLLAVFVFMTAMGGMTVAAEDAKTEVEGIRWFPCEPGRENDEIWEVEYEAEGCLCQRFTDNVDTTGYANYLDTIYNDDGSLTLRRNGVDGQGGHYWPRIRTLSLENYPELDLTVADTLYFDFTATGCQWMIALGINGMTVGLAKDISDACGVSGVETSINDGNAGHYSGSLNLRDALARIAQEDTANALSASAILKMKTTFVPQLQIYYVGDTNGELTVNSLFISTADDTTGEKCDYLDMGLLFGDEYYEVDDDELVEDPDDDPAVNITTVPAATTAPSGDAPADNGGNLLWIILPVAAVVILGAVVAVVIVRKKRT